MARTTSSPGARTFAEDLRTIPNMLSISRMVAVTVAASVFFAGYYTTGVIIGIAAGLTDYLDGILARRLGQVTKLGEILDQFSDLFFETACILMLVTHPEGPHPMVLFAYLVREFWVTTIRRFLAACRINIASSFIGKLKTNFFGWCFAAYFFHVAHVFPEPFDTAMFVIGVIGLYGGLLWSYISAWQYSRQFMARYPDALAYLAAKAAAEAEGGKAPD